MRETSLFLFVEGGELWVADGAGVAFLAPARVGLVAMIGAGVSFLAAIDKTIQMKWDEDSKRIADSRADEKKDVGGEKNQFRLKYWAYSARRNGNPTDPLSFIQFS
jgi:hypothetical protein